MSNRILLLALLPIVLHAADVTQLSNDPTIKAALEAIKRNEPEILAEQRRFCEIAAPPFMEQKRGLEFERIFKSLGLQNVRIDQEGNVHGALSGIEVPATIAAGASEAQRVALEDPLSVAGGAPRRLLKPLCRFDVQLAERATFALYSDGLAPEVPRPWGPGEAFAQIAAGASGDVQELADEVVAHAVKRFHGKSVDDFLTLVLRRL